MTYLIRGQAYQALGEDKKAIKDFTKSLHTETIGDYSIEKYLSSQSYDISTELRLLHNAEVYQRRAICLARTGNSTQATQDMKQSARLGFYPRMDACLSQPGMGAIAP